MLCEAAAACEAVMWLRTLSSSPHEGANPRATPFRVSGRAPSRWPSHHLGVWQRSHERVSVGRDLYWQRDRTCRRDLEPVRKRPSYRKE